MKPGRFTFTRFAAQDIDQIILYLETLPEEPARKVGRDLQQCLKLIGRQPMIGRSELELSATHAIEIRSWLCSNYRIYYHLRDRMIEVVAVLHHAQEQGSILKSRIT